MEKAHLYRETSVDRIQSPEQLNHYLRVTNPSVWVLLTAVILLLVGFLIWGAVNSIDSVAHGEAQMSGGSMTIRFDDEAAAAKVGVGMRVTVGETSAEIRSVGQDENGPFAIADADLPDGIYEVSVLYRRTRILKLLFE